MLRQFMLYIHPALLPALHTIPLNRLTKNRNLPIMNPSRNHHTTHLHHPQSQPITHLHHLPSQLTTPLPLPSLHTTLLPHPSLSTTLLPQPSLSTMLLSPVLIMDLHLQSLLMQDLNLSNKILSLHMVLHPSLTDLPSIKGLTDLGLHQPNQAMDLPRSQLIKTNQSLAIISPSPLQNRPTMHPLLRVMLPLLKNPNRPTMLPLFNPTRLRNRNLSIYRHPQPLLQ